MRVIKYTGVYSPKHGQLNLIVPFNSDARPHIGSYGFVWTNHEGVLL